MADKDLLSEALDLPREERARLAHELIRSLDDDEPPADPSAVERAWSDEIRRRVDDLESGRVQGIPAETVFTDLRAELAERRRRHR